MLTKLVVTTLGVIAWVAAIGAAYAQTGAVPPPEMPVAVSFVGGLSAGAPGSGGAVGGRLTYDFNERLALEGTGTFLDRGPGTDAVSVNLSLLVNLVGAGHRAVPYVIGGGGIYRASFDLGHQRMFASLGSQFSPGTYMVPLGGMHGFGMTQAPWGDMPWYGMTEDTWQGMHGSSWDGMHGSWATEPPPGWTESWTGGTFMPDHMPGFYANRLGPMMIPADGNWGTRSFTDPALSFGGGLKLDLTSQLFVQPDARALVIFGGGDSYTVGLFSFSFGYRF